MLQPYVIPVRGESLDLLCVSFLQIISRVKGVGRTKDRGEEGVGEVWELVGLPDVLSEGVLMKEE